MTDDRGHVFVSHSSDNREQASELAAFLEARGARVWIAPRDVRPGMDYSEELQTAIEGCAAFVVLVTDMANRSPYVRAETEMAFSGHKPIFPVRTSDIQPAAGLALFLKIRHWTDAYGPRREQNLDRLALELRALSGAPAREVQQTQAMPAAPPSEPLSPPLPPSAPSPPAPAAQAAPPAPLPTPGSAEEETWRAAVGPNADLYLERWRQMEAKGSAISWNWAACLANIFWFAYRKMWLAMIAFLVLNLLIAAAGATDPASARISLFLSIGLTFVSGSFGTHWYRKQTARLVADTAGEAGESRIESLRRRGGVSMPALMISLGVLAVLVLLAVIGAAARMNEQNQLAPAAGSEEPQPDKPPADYYEDY